MQTSQVKKDFSIMLVNPEHPYFYLRNFKFLAHSENLVLYYQQRNKQESAAIPPGTYEFSWEDFLDSQNRRSISTTPR